MVFFYFFFEKWRNSRNAVISEWRQGFRAIHQITGRGGEVILWGAPRDSF